MDVDVGVTATRGGLTVAQLHFAGPHLRYLAEQSEGTPVLRHGCCVGGDEMMHQLARAAGYRIIGHPPTDQRWMARGLDCDEWTEPEPFIRRNHAIVDRCSEMLCLPGQVGEQRRGSGTWATVRYAAGCRPGLLVYPSGVALSLEEWLALRQ